MRPIDADALSEDMMYEMCGTGYQSLALSVIGRAPTIAPQTNATLDRNKWKGCDCCKGDLDGYTAQFRDASGRSRPIYIPEGEAMIVAAGKYNHQFCIPIGYCPHCGRPLTEKSWEELEKQVHDLTQPPNDPLTPEELREMDGEPVWVVFTPDADGERLTIWALVSVDEENDEVFLQNSIGGRSSYEEVREKVEAIYRRRPEEAMA